MRSIFIDTNVLIDLLVDRKPFSKHAIEIFSLAETKEINLYTSSHTIATTYYVLKKYSDESELRKIFYGLLDFVKIIAVDENVVRKALMSTTKDFEDGIPLMSAITVKKIDSIITRNPKDFKGSTIKIVTPDKFLSDFKNKKTPE